MDEYNPKMHEPADPVSQASNDRSQRESFLEALLQATGHLANGEDVETVLKLFCDSLVAATPHIRMVWVYLGDPQAAWIRPFYSAGPASAHTRNLAIGTSPAEMQGPARRTLTTGRPVVMQVATDQGFAAWRDSALANNIHVVASFAFHYRSNIDSGLLAIGADQADFFDKVGLEPLMAFAHLCETALAQAAIRKQLEIQATHDLLTGIYNRRAFEALLRREHARAQRHSHQYCLLLLDIDRFKLINDSYGHPVGDQVLQHITHHLQQSLRESDVLARWGGEEFICLLPDTTVGEALQVAERLRQLISQTAIPTSGYPIQTSVSIGLSCFPDHGEQPDTLLAHADAQLYTAKRQGRNRIAQQTTDAPSVFSLIGQVETALREGRLQAAYQPIIKLADRQIEAEEVLARILTPDGEIWPASIFIEACSQFNLVHRIDEAMLRQALMRCAQRTLKGDRHLYFINVSGDLLRHPELIDEIIGCIQEQCLICGKDPASPKPLVLEITERELLGDTQHALQSLQPFLNFGLRLALDDFGKGYSTFRHLVDLPISFLKIDARLVQQSHTEPKARAVIRHIQQLAEELELTTIGEGVETEATAQLLQNLGIDWAQGYYFGRPLLG